MIEADYIGSGQLRAQHHHHPRQLRHPGVDPLLQPQRRAVPDAGGRDRLLDHARQQGPDLDGPHRDRDACRAVACATQQRVRCRDTAGRPDGDQAACARRSTSAGGGRYPVLGASYHVPGSTARHDRVVWAYARAPCSAVSHVLQGTPVTGLLRDGDRVVGVRDGAAATFPPVS